MEVKDNITVTIENKANKTINTYEDEYVSIQRASHLWIENLSEDESGFFIAMKMTYETDKKFGSMSSYNIDVKPIDQTSISSIPIQPLKYYIKKVDDEDQTIHFAWYD